MNKEKILMIIMPILLLIMAILGYIKAINVENDSIRFKNEYESLNKEYYKVSISSDNNIKYSSYDEIFKILNSDEGIIFLGSPKDNNSRYAINTLLKMLETRLIELKVHYLDISNDRDSYTIIDDKVVYNTDSNGKEIKGSKNYLKLVKLLDDNLSEYVLNLDGKEYKTGVKRIYLPAVIFVLNEKVIGIEYASTDISESELYDIYEGYILDMYPEDCGVNEGC